MGNKSYQYWQCEKCDEMNLAGVNKCSKCGAPIPSMYSEESELENPYHNDVVENDVEEAPINSQERNQSSYRKKEKTLPELKKEFLSVWITVGNIAIFCFIVNVIIIIGLFLALANGTIRM